MKYTTPQVQVAGVASTLIQAKDTTSSDNGVTGRAIALSNLLEQK